MLLLSIYAAITINVGPIKCAFDLMPNDTKHNRVNESKFDQVPKAKSLIKFNSKLG